MSRALSLPDFEMPEAGAVSDPSPETDQTLMADQEEARLAAFEQGYRSGWEDSAAAEAEERGHIGADLAANLRDLSVGYEAVRRDVLAALGPLFEAVIDRLLPELAAAAVAPVVRDELLRIAESASAARPEVIAAPTAIPMLERLIEAMPDVDARLRPEHAYAEGQVSIRFGVERRDIDLDAAARQMAEAIRAFTQDAVDQPDAAPTAPDLPRKGAA